MSIINRITAYFKQRQLLLVIFIAIALAFVMTAISLHLYNLDDVSRLDVSLPNRENIRPAANQDEATKFGSSGALDTKALTDFQTLYSKSRDDLNKLGSFDGDPLNPDALQSMGSANE